MIPKWIFQAMRENEHNCVMAKDEHGRPITEHEREVVGKKYYSKGKPVNNYKR